jgi:hypothetical protein
VKSRLLIAVAAADLVVVAAFVGVVHAWATAIVALLLAPAAVFAVAAVAGRLDPRPGFAVGAAAVYVALPVVAGAFFLAGYRHEYFHVIAPALVGARIPWALALGVALAFVVARAPERPLAAAGVVALLAAGAYWGLGGLDDVRTGVHETGWSVTFLEWLPRAGVVGAAPPSPWLAATLGSWLGVFVLRGADAGYSHGEFWRALAPAMPAAAVLVSALALLVPPIRSRSATPARAR